MQGTDRRGRHAAGRRDRPRPNRGRTLLGGLRAYGVRTSKAGIGADRGPSAPPPAFGLESLLDQLAVKLDPDPRRRNTPKAGQVVPSAVDRGRPWPAPSRAGCRRPALVLFVL